MRCVSKTCSLSSFSCLKSLLRPFQCWLLLQQWWENNASSISKPILTTNKCFLIYWSEHWLFIAICHICLKCNFCALNNSLLFKIALNFSFKVNVHIHHCMASSDGDAGDHVLWSKALSRKRIAGGCSHKASGQSWSEYSLVSKRGNCIRLVRVTTGPRLEDHQTDAELAHSHCRWFGVRGMQ